MNINEPLGQILLGFGVLTFGVLLFLYILNQTHKKEKEFNSYTFNVYFASIVSMIVGLCLIFIGVKSLFYAN